MSLLKRHHKDPPPPGDPFDFLLAHGEMAQRIREKDWAKTPLGSVEDWPQALKSALSICLATKFATYVWWGEDLIQLYNDACIRILRDKHPSALGQPAKEAWREVWDEVGPIVDQVLAQREAVFAEDREFIPERDNTLDSAFFTFCYAPLLDNEGNTAGIFITVLETTEKMRSALSLRESTQRLRAIIESAVEYAIITFDAEGRITSWNPGAERVLGYSEEEAVGQPGEIFFTPEDREAGVPEIEMTKAREYGRANDERWHMRKNGSRFWASGVMLPVEDHKRDRYLKIFRDNTEVRHAEQRQKLLTDELTHRVKNILMVVQSIAMQTLRQSSCGPEVRDMMESRLVALARAYDALTSSKWTGGELRETIERTLQLLVHDSFSSRVQLDGPEVHLNAGALLGLALAFHELATNAIKYGALSNDSGQVHIRWEIMQAANPELHLRWVERGGPPVEAPSRRGFGSRVIEEGLAHEFAGRVEMKFAREGLECTIRAPLNELTD